MSAENTAYRSFVRSFLEDDLQFTTWKIFEYNDEQRLDNSKNEYGPIVHIFANPKLATLTQGDYAAPGVIAAVMLIDPNAQGDLPASYTAVGLHKGFTCLIMVWTGAAWDTFTLKADTDGANKTCRTAQKTQLSLAEHKPFPDPNAYPPVARFQETETRQIVFGVRCLAAWCEVGAQGRAGTRPDVHASLVAASPAPAIPQATVPLWADDQRLGVMKTKFERWWFRKKLRPRMSASIVPSPDLGQWVGADFHTPTGKLVAVVVAPGTMAAKYKAFGMKTGENKLWLRRVDAAGDKWQARFEIGPRTFGDWMNVERQDHHDVNDATFKVPATARWAWLEDDEEIWVQCDVGCCRVQSGGIQ